jgi:hypothetical protein
MEGRVRLSPAAVLAVGAVVAAGGGFAIAATSSGTVVHGCVNKQTGLLRVLKGHQHCTRHESKLDLNKQGVPGRNGAPGAAVVLRSRGSGDVVTQSCTASSCTPFSPQTYPMTPASWTQGATEDDQVFGEATITSSGAACSSSFPTGFGPSVAVVVDGKALTASTPFLTSSGAGTSTVQIPLATMFEPGTATAHTLSARVSDNCNTGVHFTINSVKIDVAAMR